VIVCRECGHANEGDAQFCAACGGFLEWAGEPVEAPEETPVEVPAETVAVAEAVAVATGAGPAQLRPAAEYTPPAPKPLAPPPTPEPGQLLCDQCGGGNRPQARFCRRCGASLADASTVPHPAWWRRLLVWRRRPKEAGDRPRGWKGVRRRFSLSRVLRIVSLVSFALVLVGVGGWRSEAYARIADAYRWGRLQLFGKYEPVVPVRTGATSHVRGHRARLAFDENKDTYWAEGALGDGRGQRLGAEFDRPVDVAGIGVRSGVPTDFVAQPAPRTLRVAFFDGRGRRIGGSSLSLAQKPDFQRFSVEGKGVRRVIVTVAGVYGSQKGHAAAIAELEFFERR
jgi:ribosomal protein L40E